MSYEFITSGLNSQSLHKASKQQKRVLQYAKSLPEYDDVVSKYTNEYIDRHYATDDLLGNYLKSFMRSENFLSIYKMMRKPLPSSSLINNKVMHEYSRVLYAEDSYFSYNINGKTYQKNPSLGSDIQYQEYLNNICFRSNDVYITDIDDKENIYSYLLSIDNIKSLDHDNRRITRIGFKTETVVNGKLKPALAYIDDEYYKLYDVDGSLIRESRHGLTCPARFVGTLSYDIDFVVKQNPFSYVLPKLEHYNLLTICNRFIEMKGTFPRTVNLRKDSNGSSDIQSALMQDPSSDNEIGGKDSEEKRQFSHNDNNQHDIGQVEELSLNDIEDLEGKVNMDILRNFVTHFHMPVDVLRELRERLKLADSDIVNDLLGTHDLLDQEGSKSDNHLEEKLSSREDRLRGLSQQLSLLVHDVEKTELSLEYGVQNIELSVFFGSKFFLESEASLINIFNNLPNPIEKKDVLVRLSNKKNRLDSVKKQRNKILYDLIPYISDTDFDKAVERGVLDVHTFMLQTKFNYYIGMLESEEGSVVDYIESFKDNYNVGIQTIRNQIYKIIKDEQESVNSIGGLPTIQRREQDS